MDAGPLPFQKIVFVCVNRREAGEICCAHRDSEAIAAALKDRIKALGLSRLVRVSKSGCQDLCAKGPNVMIFPDNRWYHAVTPADVDAIIQAITHALVPSSMSSTA
jgi:(2Fe-2S) ferredoxin